MQWSEESLITTILASSFVKTTTLIKNPQSKRIEDFLFLYLRKPLLS